MCVIAAPERGARRVDPDSGRFRLLVSRDADVLTVGNAQTLRGALL